MAITISNDSKSHSFVLCTILKYMFLQPLRFTLHLVSMQDLSSDIVMGEKKLTSSYIYQICTKNLSLPSYTKSVMIFECIYFIQVQFCGRKIYVRNNMEHAQPSLQSLYVTRIKSTSCLCLILRRLLNIPSLQQWAFSVLLSLLKGSLPNNRNYPSTMIRICLTSPKVSRQTDSEDFSACSLL